jgi:Uma2 family endonuclease
VRHAPIFSAAPFRTWLTLRPDEEHWELIGGVPMMMAPNRRHQRITGNLEPLLDAAVKRHNPWLAAYQAIAVNIVSTMPSDPEPDVAVIREDENPDLATPIASIRSDIYRAQASCTCILLVRQDRMEIVLERRTGDGWQLQVLHGDDEFILSEIGLTGAVRDIYLDTRLG